MKTNLRFLRRKNGFMVVSLILIMGMMSFYAATNIRTLAILKSELQILEQKQTQHWRK